MLGLCGTTQTRGRGLVRVGVVGLMVLGILLVIGTLQEGWWPERFDVLARTAQTLGLLISLALVFLWAFDLIERWRNRQIRAEPAVQ